MFSDKEMASLIAKLQVPLVVADQLPYPEALTDDEEYALHEMLSEMQPDSALLAIALSAEKIAGLKEKVSPVVRFLKLECERIASLYAPLWIHNADGGVINEEEAAETLSNIPEDLHDLSELIESCNVLFEKTVPKAAALGRILSVQARAQSIVAEAYIEALEQSRMSKVAPVIADVAMNNVVPFRNKNI